MPNRAERRRERFDRNREPGFTPVWSVGNRGSKHKVEGLKSLVAPQAIVPLKELRRGQRVKSELLAKSLQNGAV